MIAALLLAAAAAAQAEPPSASAAYWALPREVEVGEPFRWVVEVRHADGRLRDLGEQLALFAVDLDESWVLLDEDPVLTAPDPDRAGWSRTRAGWRAISLEPGERPLPPLELLVGDERVPVLGGSVSVAGVLAPGEDAPRPARGLREPPVPEAGPSLLLPAALAGLAVLAALTLLLRRRRAGPAPEPDARERLRTLLEAAERTPPAGSGAVDLAYELSAGVRAVLDERDGVDRRGLTDEEWLAARAGTPGAERADELARHLARCTEIECGAREPSPWALKELLEEARMLTDTAAEPAGAAR